MPPSPPPAAAPGAAVDLDSLAADMLAARHTALLTRRRQRSLEAEVEWDERDTAARRGRVVGGDGGVWASMGYGGGRRRAEEEERGGRGFPQPEEEWHGGFNDVPDEVIEGPGAADAGTLGDSFGWTTAAARRRRRRLGEDDWTEEDQALFEEIGADAFFGYGSSGSEDDNDVDEFSETEDDNGDGAGAGDRVDAMDYDALAAAAAAPLEFATRLDEEEAYFAGLRERGRRLAELAELGQDTPAVRQELQALLSGRYVGEAPLDPPPAPRTDAQQHYKLPPHPFLPDLNVAAAELLSQDPSSALSYTSFLRPGAFFVGEQSLGKNSQSSSSLREPPLPWRNNGPNTSSLAHPAFAPFPSLGAAGGGGGGISDSLAIPRSSPWATYDGGRTTTRSSRLSVSPSSLSTSSPASASRPTPSSLSVSTRSPFERPTPTATVTHVDTSSNPHIIGATRIRFGDTTNPAARSDRESWRAVEREMLSRARGRVREPEAAERKERWNVHVTIQSYEPMNKRITGFMRAFGVEGGTPVSNNHSDVTTSFSGDILHPIIDGLFASPSLTGSGGRTGSVKVSRAVEAESWIQLGPFKGLSKAELLDKAKSRQWVEEQTRGWILFRWKEQGFVNVAPADSVLSISGFYHAVLNRRTGEIEGLYCDPAATPNQQLHLRPTSNASGAVSFGAFECR